jgi:hypothetical protein
MTDIKALERQTADDLALSLAGNPTAWAWRNNDFDMLAGPGGISISTTYFTVYQPVLIRFGFWNKRRIRRAFKAWKRSTGNELANQERHKALLTLRRCLVEMRAVA